MNKPRSSLKFSERLLQWFDVHGRHNLPWQQGITPYRVWVSEIMLQQTQVKTVIPYFERFMQSFPTVQALAAAEIDDVLHHWSGLGYYARGRNLHRAAKLTVENNGGELPTDIDELIALPGIGRSTAGAIVSISHGQVQPILDGNVKRVLARHQCVSGAVESSATQKILWQLAGELTPTKRVANYTQAIMDLGATICTRSKPNCTACPVSNDCLAKLNGTQSEFPHRKKRKALPERHAQFVFAQDIEGNVILEKRPPSGIWGGLWCLPQLEASETISKWCERFGITPLEEPVTQETLRHTFTHFRLTLEPIKLQVKKKGTILMDSDRWLWYNASQPQALGIAKPMAELLKTLT